MKNYFFVLILVTVSTFGYAQGCSDAGICSIGHGFQSDEKELKNSVGIASVFGAGEADVTYFSPFISYTRKINENWSLSSKVTFSSANGAFGTSTSLGDAFLSGNYTFETKNNKQWSTLLGFKIPFTNSDLKIDEKSLPLDYQSSLGTYDLFIGGNFKYNNWDFNSAIQIPVINNNKNSYFKEFSGTNDFPSTNRFERRSDALFRTTYTLKTANKKFIFKPNVLFIYHLGEDSYETIQGDREKIKGSDGLTINGNLLTTYVINNHNSIELSMATPFVIRDIRPDGLTRAYVVSIQYNIIF
ncbi:hypothetical protein [Flavobacterium sp. WC2429]|uniref:Transporter n=2 Tax=unclassified Flavobacterium TaxID=196869 RepID=A0AB39WCH0_9FLAO